jgi:hypothetical protein
MKVGYLDVESKAVADAIAILKKFGFNSGCIYQDPKLGFDIVIIGYFKGKTYKSFIGLTDTVNTPYGVTINPAALQIAINDLCSQATGSNPYPVRPSNQSLPNHHLTYQPYC